MKRIIAMAGRRIDHCDQRVARFPLARTSWVYDRIRRLFMERDACGLVCSAASGCDLIALQAAQSVGLQQRTVILPFRRALFRETSVVDRPGEWGPCFDRAVDAAARAGDLVILNDSEPSESDRERAYAAVNSAILAKAMSMAEHARAAVLAVVVWDRRRRSGTDMTAEFATRARSLRLPLMEIPTL
ncbi:MAG: hypothetical protein M3T49_09890 [Candidatus Eremiobacteraeota bacterium]|nr:hypothetical protein [Candidatus Eremiobacteraeota bacterium]